MKKVWIDYLRVFASFAVVCTHITVPFYNKIGSIDQVSWWMANIISAFSRCAVPVFLMISGSLLLGKFYPIKDFYSKRVRRLILPMIFWSIIFIVFRVLSGENFLWIMNRFLLEGKSYSHLWYLTMIVCVMTVTPFINSYILGEKPSDKQVLLIILIIFGYCTIYWVSASLKIVKGYEITWIKSFPYFLGYFVAGYYLSKLSVSISHVCLFFVVVVLSLTGSIFNFLSCKYLEIVNPTFVLHLFSPFMVLIVFCTFLLFKENNLFIKNKFINSFADASFGIYLIHPIYVAMVNKTFSNYFEYGFIFIPVSILITYVLSFWTISLMRKFSIGKILC